MTTLGTPLLRAADRLIAAASQPDLSTWITMMSPAVAAPLAALLRAEADRLDGESAPTRQAYRESLPGMDLATIILGEAS